MDAGVGNEVGKWAVEASGGQKFGPTWDGALHTWAASESDTESAGGWLIGGSGVAAGYVALALPAGSLGVGLVACYQRVAQAVGDQFRGCHVGETLIRSGALCEILPA